MSLVLLFVLFVLSISINEVYLEITFFVTDMIAWISYLSILCILVDYDDNNDNNIHEFDNDQSNYKYNFHFNHEPNNEY